MSASSSLQPQPRNDSASTQLGGLRQVRFPPALPRMTKIRIDGCAEAYALRIGVKQIGCIACRCNGAHWEASVGVGKAARQIGTFPRKLDAIRAVLAESQHRIERLVDEFRQSNMQ